jgi:hypothetical protein
MTIQIKQNPDEALVKEIRAALKANEGYCPCEFVKNEYTKCMCAEFRSQIERGVPGMCSCGLYICEIGGEA